MVAIINHNRVEEDFLARAPTFYQGGCCGRANRSFLDVELACGNRSARRIVHADPKPPPRAGRSLMATVSPRVLPASL